MKVFFSLVILLLFGIADGSWADTVSFKKISAENVALRNKNAILLAQFNDIFNDRLALLKRIQKLVILNADLEARVKNIEKTRVSIIPTVKKVSDAVIVNHHPQEIYPAKISSNPLPVVSKDFILKTKLEESVFTLIKTEHKNEILKQQVALMHYNLGVVFQNQNEYDKAIKEFKKDLNLDPTDADAYYNLALIYDKNQNNRQEALRQYTMYLKLKPHATDVLKIKERVMDLEIEQRVWGHPENSSIGENQTLGRM